MNEEKDSVYQYIRARKRGGITVRRLCGLMAVMAVMLSSCTDDVLSPDDPGSYPEGFQTLKTYDLPGVMALSLSSQDIDITRADQTSDGRPLVDGILSEYDLSEQNGDECYHYLLLFGNEDNSKPVIFPLENKPVSYNSDRNITLTVSKVFADGALDPKGDESVLSSMSSLSDFIKGRKAYVVLNFKLDNNYVGTLTGENTVKKLANITKAQFESLQMTDYKVQGKKTITSGSGDEERVTVSNPNFFTMSNSVYSDGTAKVVDGTTIDTSKIYSNEDDALANPAIKVYVERLASKITVNFNAAKMKEVGYFGPSESDHYAIDEVTIESDGLPLMQTWVNRVNMENDGIHYTDKGYEILTEKVQARIKIIGFGVSNLESTVGLYKTVDPSYGTTSWQWSDPNNHRSYWSEDQNYDLVKVRGKNGNFTKILGYPHQFRRALDSDTVSSYHAGRSVDYEYAKGSENVKEGYSIAGEKFTSYAEVGDILNTPEHRISGVVLNYKSFDELSTAFSASKLGYSINSGAKTVAFDPFYTMENTYWDEGMFLRTGWQWPWYRAPHGVATNLMVLAQIEIKGNLVETEIGYDQGTETLPNSGRRAKTREGEGDDAPYVARTLYLGQNNIFYLRKVNLLKSKLAILNNVMLSGGNAGIQILRGQWDSHQRGEGADNLLDKVAWNEGSKLWIAEVETVKDAQGNDLKDAEGNLILDYEEKIGHDADNKEYTYNQVKLKNVWPAKIDNSNGANEDDQDLDLIPAEISGGDGQCLIAPNKKWMGAKYKYYLAPESAESTETDPQMDMDKAVEISYNHLVALIHKIIGPVDVYKNGYMYYNVPIPHRVSAYNGRNGAEDWARFGAYSVVRNNWYNISVTEITKLGTPVHVPSQPIVPVMDVKRSYLNMGVELLNWHDITQDNIPLM